jgi:cytochrome c oxidase subunit IV
MSEHDHPHVIIPPSTYAKNFAILLILMVLTIAAAQFHIGPEGWSLFNNLIAMAIATTKAVLVILFFMGVKYGTKLTKLWAVTGFLWFFLLLGILGDYVTRGWETQSTSWDPREERKLEVTGSAGVGRHAPTDEPKVGAVPNRN